MKKHILLLASAALLFSSCNEEYDFDTLKTPKLNLNVNIKSVITPFSNVNYFGGISDTYNIILKTLVYNQQGKLVAEAENKFNSYDNEINLDFDLEKGKYKVVNMTIIKDIYNDYSFWSVLEYDNLNTLSVDLNYISSISSTLGLDMQELEVGDGFKKNIIHVKPATGVLKICYSNFKSARPDVRNISTYFTTNTIIEPGNNDIYQHDDLKDRYFSFVSNLNPYNFLDQSRIMGYVTLLPGNDYKLTNIENIGEDKFNTTELNYSIEAGKTTTFYYDFGSGVISQNIADVIYDGSDDNNEEEVIIKEDNEEINESIKKSYRVLDLIK